MHGLPTGRAGLAGTRARRKKGARCCNLCGGLFRPRTAFDRFCGRCRREEELLRFSEWLPEIDESGAARAIA